MSLGFQTEEFMSRLKTYEKSLPGEVIRMAETLREMIQEIDTPSPEDIEKLHDDLRKLIRSSKALIDVCGDDGALCGNCPFGAYLPDGVPHASSKAPFCLPWIAVGQPGTSKAADQVPPR